MVFNLIPVLCSFCIVDFIRSIYALCLEAVVSGYLLILLIKGGGFIHHHVVLNPKH